MPELVITNVDIYKDIAKEAYEAMRDAMDRSISPIPGGSGSIHKFDPNRVSFKSAMIAVVFTGMWLEAITHLLIVEKHGKAKFKQLDFSSYEHRLRNLGIEDDALLIRVKKFREARRELVHEKAFLDKGIRVAQKEAELAFNLLSELDEMLLDIKDRKSAPGDE